MNDWISEYLLKENFYLTALEFYQELLENGQENNLLKDFFENKKWVQGYTPTQSTQIQPKEFQLELQKKDEKISVLEYENENLKNEMSKLRIQLAQVFTPAIRKRLMSGQLQLKTTIPESKSHHDNLSDTLTSQESQPSTSQKSDDTQSPKSQTSTQTTETNKEDEFDHIVKQEIQPAEKQVLNFLVKKYLKDNGYKVTAISLTEEVDESEMFDIDEITSKEDYSLDLLYLYRYYYKMPSTDRKQKTEDQKALRDALSKLEKKNELAQSLEKQLKTQMKEMEKMRLQIHQLELEIEHLKSQPKDEPKPDEEITENVEEKSTSLPATPIKQTEQPKEKTIPVVERQIEDNFKLSATQQQLKEEIEILEAKMRELDNDEGNIIRILGSILPNLVSSIKSTKRKDVIPLILVAIEKHPESKVRDNLASTLFNLVKKPDEEQRKAISEACIQLARKISPERFEAEFLPQCWEQITHKYAERRILVADTCGALAAYVKPELSGSLLLSMLQQLQEDKLDVVRAAVAHNMAKLSSVLEKIDHQKTGKFPKVEEMLLSFLNDSSDIVVKTAKEELFPIVAQWAVDAGFIYSQFIEMILARIQTELVAERGKDTPRKLCTLLQELSWSVPFLYKFILNSIPDHIITKFAQSDKIDEIERANIFNRFIEESTDPWDNVDWYTKILIPSLFSITVCVQIDMYEVIHHIYKVFQDLCNAFGVAFTKKRVQPLFINAIANGEVSLIQPLDERTQKLLFVRSKIVPVYICGVLHCLGSEAFQNYVTDLITKIALQEQGWDLSHEPILRHAFTSGTKFKLSDTYLKLQEDILTCTNNLVVHPSNRVRTIIVHLFNEMVDGLAPKTISNEVLPAMITLSADPDHTVRSQVLLTMGKLVLNLSSEKDFDKIGLQFDSFFSDPNRVYAYETLKLLSSIIPKVDATFRDKYILPKLYNIGKENNSNTNISDRKEIANLLFNAYKALNGCLLTKSQIITFIKPGLENLLNDCDVAGDVNFKNTLTRMLKDINAAVPTEKKEEKKFGSKLLTGGFSFGKKRQ